MLEECRRPFLTGSPSRPCTEGVMPGGQKGTAIGVLSADPRTREFPDRSLMTIEGLVLFDIEAGETLIVHRAVPPFDAPAFARRLAEDIGLAFFSPGEEPAALGGGGRGRPWSAASTRPTEGLWMFVTARDGAMEIRLYGTGQELRKRVIMSPPAEAGPGRDAGDPGRLAALHAAAQASGKRGPGYDSGTAPAATPPAPNLPAPGAEVRKEKECHEISPHLPPLAEAGPADGIPPAAPRSGGLRRDPAAGVGGGVHRRERGAASRGRRRRSGRHLHDADQPGEAGLGDRGSSTAAGASR